MTKKTDPPKNTPPKQSPKVRCLMYTQQEDYWIKRDWQDEVKRIVAITKPQHWAAICHDKDVTEDGESVTPHIHLVLYFKNPRSPQNVAWEIGNRQGKREDAQTERLEFFKRPNNAYSYLVHFTEHAKDKYQYDPNEVLANFDFPKKIAVITKSVERSNGKKEDDLIKEYLDLLYDGTLSLSEIENELSGSLYAKAVTRLKAVSDKQTDFKIKAFLDNISRKQTMKTIIYLYGKAGTGKTRLAKHFLTDRGQDYFISGSSRDPFQGYANQNAVILDELRPDTFRFDDLLKLLDPYRFDAMIPSRYSDKVLTVDTLIITSPYSPRQLYDKMFSDASVDSFAQLERRLTSVIEITKDYLYHVTYDTKTQAYLKIKNSQSPNPIKARQENKHPQPDEVYQNFISHLNRNEDTSYD